MDMFFATAIRPFIVLALFMVAFIVARMIAGTIPNGRIKDVLFDREIQKQHPWKFALLGFVTIWGVILLPGFIMQLLA